MTDKKLKEKFIEILKFNMLEPTIDPEDGNFEDHLSIQLWKFFINELAIAREEDKRLSYNEGVEDARLAVCSVEKNIWEKYVYLRIDKIFKLLKKLTKKD